MSELEILRADALQKRIKNVPGGLHVFWSTRDIARIDSHIKSLPEKMLRDVPTASTREAVNTHAAAFRRRASEQGLVLRDLQPDDSRFLFIISSEAVDRSGDVITVSGMDLGDYIRNPMVLDSHDGSAMPIALSSAPLLSGSVLTAIAQFPEGVSERSDQVAAAVRAKLIKGASVGFVPQDWEFTKDPSRPYGINFKRTKLLEWSICSVPCNGDCLMIGSAAGKSARRSSEESDIKTAARRREAAALAATARLTASIGDDPAPTREQRLAEAKNFRRLVNT